MSYGHTYSPDFFRSCAQGNPSAVFDLNGEELAYATGWCKATAAQKAREVGVYTRMAHKEVYNRFDTSNFACNGYRSVRYSVFRITAAQIVSIQKTAR